MNSFDKAERLQEIAFAEEKVKINGKYFSCFETYYDQHVLNGVDLTFHHAKGINNNPQLLDFFPESQELLYAAGTNIISFNSHKRQYALAAPLIGSLLIIKTYTEKFSNKEYFLFAEHVARTSLPALSCFQAASPLIHQQGSISFAVRLYDQHKKQLLHTQLVNMHNKCKLKDLFVFDRGIKMVGFVVEDTEMKITYIHYQILHRKSNRVQLLHNQKDGFIDTPTETIALSQHSLSKLQYSEEMNSYFFSCGNMLYNLALNIQEGEMNFGGSALELILINTFQEQVMGLAINETYLAILTVGTISLYSCANDSYSLATHELKKIYPDCKLVPNYLTFNRNFLLLSYKESLVISTFAIKNIKHLNDTTVEIDNAFEINRLLINPYSSEVLCIVHLAELNNKIISQEGEATLQSMEIDIFVTYVGCTSKSEAKRLGISHQKYRKIHICAWNSIYFLETQSSIQSRKWCESFQNKKCIVLHPTGLFMVICFKDCFRIFAVTVDGVINTYRGDTGKDIQTAVISEYGNHLAVAKANANGNSIVIYDFFKCAKIKTISIMQSSPIEKLEYAEHSLVCTLRNKKIFIFCVPEDYKETLFFNPKIILSETTQFVNAIFCDPKMQIIVFSSKKAIYFYSIQNNCLMTSFAFRFKVTCFYYNTNLSTLFMGTDSGQIINFPWPNKPTNFLSETKVYKFHKSKVVDIKATEDLTLLISLGEDESLYFSSITYVSQLKRLEGLSIIEHKQGIMRCGYDLLKRRGLDQYTHTLFHQKSDTVKEYEDQVVNMNFILPEESMKEKENMFAKVEASQLQLKEEHSSKNGILFANTVVMKQKVANLRQKMEDFEIESQKKKSKCIEELQANEHKIYKQNMELQLSKQSLQLKYHEDVKALKSQQEREAGKQQESFIQEQKILRVKYLTNNVIMVPAQKEELSEIAQEKEAFLNTHVQQLVDQVNQISASNGILMCRNSSTQKGILTLSRKIEDDKYMIYCIENSLNNLKDCNQSAQGFNEEQLESENGNLCSIEKTYVKQTRELIKKDKEISIKIVLYDKEKSVLVYLEKHLEDIEEKIKNLVETILVQKQHSQTQDRRLDQQSQRSATLIAALAKIKRLKANRNYKLKSSLNETLQAAHSYIKQEADEHLLRKMGQKAMTTRRFVKTQIGEQNENRKPFTRMLSNRKLNVNRTERSNRNGIQEKAENVIAQLQSEDKQYLRIKNEQTNYQHLANKFIHQNEDLINTFNTLTHERKGLQTAMKKKKGEFLKTARPVGSTNRKKQPENTPFQLYIIKRQAKMALAKCSTQQ